MRRYLLIVLFLGCGCSPIVRGQQCDELYPWRLGFDFGVAVPTGDYDAFRPCFSASLHGGLDIGKHGGWLVSASMGHQRTLHSEGPDYEEVPLDTATYLRKYIVYPLTLGMGYDWNPGPEWIKICLTAEAGAAFCYQTYRKLLSLTATDASLHEVGCHGWVFAGRIGAEVLFWQHVGVGVSLLAFGKPANEEGHDSKKKSSSEDIHEVFDRHQAPLDDFGGIVACFAVTYRF